MSSFRAATTSAGSGSLGRSGGASADAAASASTSRRSERALVASIARFTTILCIHGPNGRRRSKRSIARTAARNASWAMSSAAAASCTTR